MQGKCWLIGEVIPGRLSAAGRFAHLRNLQTQLCAGVESIPARAAEPVMIAIGANTLHALSARARNRLAELAAEGATVYVRGAGSEEGLDLAPFAPSRLKARPSSIVGYRFAASRMLPVAWAGEAMQCTAQACGAEGIPPQAEPLLILRDAQGNEQTAIFALRHGKGRVIYDLHPEHEEDCSHSPLVVRLADPHTCHLDAGALVAAECATGSAPRPLPPFNLTIDDRPVNLDLFNVNGLAALLRHIAQLCPGAHTDFAWTPRHTKPSYRHLDTIKKYPTGFVWHGLHRHIDHRAIASPSAELDQGRRLVGRIQARFGVRLQPIMIFPFERVAPDQFRMLREAGFLACVGEEHDVQRIDPNLPDYLRCSLPAVEDPVSGLKFFYRYRMKTLTRARMLAMAALGLPIIAFAHPAQLGLRRLARVWDPVGDLSHFDPVLNFAAAKGLPSRSLEEIALEFQRPSAQYAA